MIADGLAHRPGSAFKQQFGWGEAMKFSFSDDAGDLKIHSYEPGRLRIRDRIFDHSLIITPDSVTPWEISDALSLDAAAMLALSEQRPDVLLLGTGARQIFPPAAVRHVLLGRGIGLEIMSTAAAARTYNILLSEDRRVVAALIV